MITVPVSTPISTLSTRALWASRGAFPHFLLIQPRLRQNSLNLLENRLVFSYGKHA